MPAKNSVLLDELRALRGKADQQVTAHSYLRDEYQLWGQQLNLYTLLLSAVLLFFTLASEDFVQRTLGLPPDAFKWVEGGAAFLTFCLSLLSLAWNPAAKAKAHDQAVGHYLRMNYEIRNLANGSQAVTPEKVRWVQEEYLDAADLPRIPESQSLRFKQRHLRKLALAGLLEKNPHQPLWWLRLRLWWRPELSLPEPLPQAPAASKRRPAGR